MEKVFVLIPEDTIKASKIYGRYDLRYGRSATVVGLMKNLHRKAKINAVGVVGLVEMVSGNAQEWRYCQIL